LIRLQTNATTSAPTRDSVNTLMPEMSLSFTLLKSSVLQVLFSGTFSNSNNDRGGIFQCVVDGVSDAQMQRQFLGQAGNPQCIAMQKLLYLTPGTHTVEIWWAATANTLTAAGIERSLTILEEAI